MIVIVPYFVIELFDSVGACLVGLIWEEQFALFESVVNERLVNVGTTGYYTIGIVDGKFVERDKIDFFARGKRYVGCCDVKLL